MQMDPDIHQHQRQAQQQEAQASTRRRGPRPNLFQEPVAALAAEAPTVPLADPPRRIDDLQTDVHEPGGGALPRPAALVGPHDYHRHRQRAVLGTLEGMRRAIAVLPLTQRTRAAVLATDRTGDDRWQVLRQQPAHDRDRAEAFFRVETADAQG